MQGFDKHSLEVAEFLVGSISLITNSLAHIKVLSAGALPTIRAFPLHKRSHYTFPFSRDVSTRRILPHLIGIVFNGHAWISIKFDVPPLPEARGVCSIRAYLTFVLRISLGPWQPERTFWDRPTTCRHSIPRGCEFEGTWRRLKWIQFRRHHENVIFVVLEKWPLFAFILMFGIIRATSDYNMHFKIIVQNKNLKCRRRFEGKQ